MSLYFLFLLGYSYGLVVWQNRLRKGENPPKIFPQIPLRFFLSLKKLMVELEKTVSTHY